MGLADTDAGLSCQHPYGVYMYRHCCVHVGGAFATDRDMEVLFVVLRAASRREWWVGDCREAGRTAGGRRVCKKTVEEAREVGGKRECGVDEGNGQRRGYCGGEAAVIGGFIVCKQTGDQD